MTEIWKELEGFSKYKFSNTGKIWSKSSNKERSLKPQKGGYIRFGLTNDEGKISNFFVHRLIASVFIPNPQNKPTVNHKNHNKADNRVENLEWATISEQNNHRKRPSKEVSRLMCSRSVWRCSINGDKIELYETLKDAAKWILDNKGNKDAWKNISNVCHNRAETAYGFKWVYDTSQENIFENEIWKNIPKELIKGYTGYKISDQGRIKNPKGRFLKGNIHPKGYKSVAIGRTSDKGGIYQIHRLVAKVFLPNYYGKPFVNHKDHNRANCKLYNLEWVTASENAKLAVQFYSSEK